MERLVGTYEKGVEILNPYSGKCRINWDKVQIDDDNSFMTEDFSYLPGIKKIRSLILGWYNSECDREILSGLKIEGNTVWLSTENQFNYKAAWDFALAKGGMNLPVTFKLGDDQNPVYKVFGTVEELDSFMITVMGYIQMTLAKYWQIKDSIDWSLYEIE